MHCAFHCPTYGVFLNLNLIVLPLGTGNVIVIYDNIYSIYNYNNHLHSVLHCPTYGHWEYDSAIVLGGDAIQRLKVPQLK